MEKGISPPYALYIFSSLSVSFPVTRTVGQICISDSRILFKEIYTYRNIRMLQNFEQIKFAYYNLKELTLNFQI